MEILALMGIRTKELQRKMKEDMKLLLIQAVLVVQGGLSMNFKKQCKEEDKH